MGPLPTASLSAGLKGFLQCLRALVDEQVLEVSLIPHAGPGLALLMAKSPQGAASLHWESWDMPAASVPGVFRASVGACCGVRVPLCLGSPWGGRDDLVVCQTRVFGCSHRDPQGVLWEPPHSLTPVFLSSLCAPRSCPALALCPLPTVWAGTALPCCP